MKANQDDLDCWPSDGATTLATSRKHNVIAFYHQILWASQLCEESMPLKRNRKGCRVSFSSEPPTIFEYEPECSKTNLVIFDYQIFRRKFQQHHQYQKDEHRQFITSKLEEKVKEGAEEDNDNNEYKNHRLMKTRSLSEFRPIRNMKFNNNKNNNTSSVAPSEENSVSSSPYFYSVKINDSVHIPLAQIDIFHTDDNTTTTLSAHNRVSPHNYQQLHYSTTSFHNNNPPPTYVLETSAITKDGGNSANSISEKIKGGSRDSGKNEHQENSKDQPFFQRTLRKIKSSPKLIEIQRRSSSLRKKKSFSSSTTA